VPLPIASALGTAHESARTGAFYYRLYYQKRRQLSGGLLSIGSISGAALGARDSYESYDRKRRQFTPPHLDFPGSTVVVEAQFPSRSGTASPKHRPHADTSRQLIADSHPSSEQNPISFSSGSVSEISTSSLSKPPPIELSEVTMSESEAAEKHASIISSAIPRPIRKPSKPIKSAKTVSAKATMPKKATGRCRNRIWRC
jgi:hypothetical protein